MGKMGKTIGIISIKGGVGKTTLAASLAADLANNHRKKILLVDANYSAPNLGLHMDIIKPEKTIHDLLFGKTRIQNTIHRKFGVDVIPGSFFFDRSLNFLKLRDKISKLSKNYDFTIIDSSPALNEEILSVILASDNLFVVTTPDYPTLFCSLRAARLAKQRGKPISGIIVNKIRNPKYEVNLADIEDSTEIPVVAKIPDDEINVRALFERVPASIYKRNSKFACELSKFSSALAGEKEKKSIFNKLFSLGPKRDEINRTKLKQDFYRKVFD